AVAAAGSQKRNTAARSQGKGGSGAAKDGAAVGKAPAAAMYWSPAFSHRSLVDQHLQLTSFFETLGCHKANRTRWFIEHCCGWSPTARHSRAPPGKGGSGAAKDGAAVGKAPAAAMYWSPAFSHRSAVDQHLQLTSFSRHSDATKLTGHDGLSNIAAAGPQRRDTAARRGQGRARAYAAMQVAKPVRILASSSSRPMKTNWLRRGSFAFQKRSGAASNIIWTPWNTTRLGWPLMCSTPLLR